VNVLDFDCLTSKSMVNAGNKIARIGYSKSIFALSSSIAAVAHCTFYGTSKKERAGVDEQCARYLQLVFELL
jgi:hypothetical protein